MNLHTAFLREGSALPQLADLRQTPFCHGWAEASGILVTQLDFGVRGVGWHFMWIAGSHSARGLAGTRETAIQKALVRALDKVGRRFNAAELGSIEVRSFLGFTMAHVTVHARHIQQHASLDGVEKGHLQQLHAH